MTDNKCLICNQYFVPQRKNARFCFNCRKKYKYKCSRKYILLNRKYHFKNCQYCGKKYKIFFGLIKYKYCNECRKKHISSYYWRRKNPEVAKDVAHRYRNIHLELCRERTRKNQINLNNNKRFGGLRFRVLLRDKYKCQKCGKDISGKNIACVHHLNKDRNDNRLDNLISYCKPCHIAYHYFKGDFKIYNSPHC